MSEANRSEVEEARPLPAGRRAPDAMTAAEVAADQRDRMLDAMTTAAAEEGYTAVTVAGVISRAKVSRATFYQQFAGRTECFLTAYDRAVQRLNATILGDGESPRSAREMVERYLDAVAMRPRDARVFLLQITAVGSEGMVRRAGSIRASAASIAEVVGARTDADRFACEAVVASVVTMAGMALATGSVDDLATLRGPLGDFADHVFPA